MTQDKLIAMAKDATAFHFDGTFNFDTQQLQAFANLIRRDQIKRDALICEDNACYMTAEEIRNQEVE